MLISLRINNYQIYNQEVEFSMKANMHIKHFLSSVYKEKKLNILKSAIIMGPNNAGKTCFIRGLRTMKHIMLNEDNIIQKNIFGDNEITEMEISFLSDKHEYSFSIKYDNKKKEYIYERFLEVFRDVHNNIKEDVLLLRDIENSVYECRDQELVSVMKVAAKNNILIYVFDTSDFPTLNRIKEAIIAFASKVDIIDMNNIPIKKTLECMKTKSVMREKVVSFIKNADLSLDDYRYLNDDELEISLSSEEKPQELALGNSKNILDLLHLTSIYNGIPVPSLFYDSTGTKKMAALASYVIEALEKGRILVVDELDNSLHFKLTRAIIAMFNNDLNINAQLIATVHDTSLLDCQTLFRKDQIWFAHKDKVNAYLYSLAEFTSEKNKVRSNTDLIENYKRGVFGALPEPDLFDSLLEVSKSVKDTNI